MTRTILGTATIVALACALFVRPSATMAQGNLNCDDPARNAANWQLVILVVGNAPGDVMRGNVNANRQYVCQGDRVTWRIPSRGFTLTFADDSLFGQAELVSGNGNRVSAVVSGNSDRGREYAYDITLDNGEVLDPHIIVD